MQAHACASGPSRHFRPDVNQQNGSLRCAGHVNNNYAIARTIAINRHSEFNIIILASRTGEKLRRRSRATAYAPA